MNSFQNCLVTIVALNQAIFLPLATSLRASNRQAYVSDRSIGEFRLTFETYHIRIFDFPKDTYRMLTRTYRMLTRILF